MCSQRRLHNLASSDEQFILEQKAQRREIMAHRRLLKLQARGGFRYTSVPHQGIEGDEQFDVKGPQIEMIDRGYFIHRFDC